MSKKLRLENTRAVLSDLNETLANHFPLASEFALLASKCKNVLTEIHVKVLKMLELIDDGGFPDDKKLQGSILELENIPIPATLNEELKKIIIQYEALHVAVDNCFGRVTKNSEDESVSVITVSIAPNARFTKISSGSKIGTMQPFARPSTAPPDSLDAVSEASRPKTAMDVRKVMANVTKRNVVDDNWEMDSKSQSKTSLFDEDDIFPEDSVSNIGIPTYRNFSTVAKTVDKFNQSDCLSIVIPRRELIELQTISKVTCEWIDNQFFPYKFWLRVDDPEYLELAKRIQKYSSNISPISPSTLIQKRLYCLAKYESEWYRAYVCEVLSDSVIVLFIDYGNSEKLSFEDVAKLPQDMAKLPWQAFSVALFAVKPLTADGCLNPNQRSSWHPDALRYLKTCFSDESIAIDCRVQVVSKTLPAIVNLRMHLATGEMVLFHKKLRELGLVDSAGREEQIQMLSIKPISRSPGDLTVVTLRPISEKPKETEQCHSGMMNPNSPVTYQKKYHQEDCAANDRKENDLMSSEEDFVQTFNNSPVSNGRLIDYCYLLPGTEFDVKITAFNSLDDFFVQLTGDSCTLDQEAAQKCVEKGGASAGVGREVVYFAQKRSIYARGKILALTENGKSLEIVDVDSGIIDKNVLFPDNVGALSTKLKKTHRAAIRVTLDRSELGPNMKLRSDFESYFKQRLSNRALNAKISSLAKIENVSAYRNGSEPLPLQIYSGTRNLGDLLLIPSDSTLTIPLASKLEDLSDDEEDVPIPPGNPDLLMINFEPKDDEISCKHFRKFGKCPRGEYCQYKHEQLPSVKTTIETEECCAVGIFVPEVGSRTAVRLPFQWKESLNKALLKKTANLIPMWLQFPLGDENWMNRENELFHTLIKAGDVTELEEPYVDLELEMTETLEALFNNASNDHYAKLIPACQMYVAARVPLSDFGGGDDEQSVWVRGVVDKVLPDDFHAEVLLVDYGNVATVPATHIRSLTEAFANRLPALALLCYVQRDSAEAFSSHFSSGDISDCYVVADIVSIEDFSLVPVIQLAILAETTKGNVSITHY